MNKSMTRRTFLCNAGALGLGLSAPSIFAAQDGEEGGPARSGFEMPFKEHSAVPGDRVKILEVVSLSCPSCREYHSLISGWATTLPKRWSFGHLPVITEDRGTMLEAMIVMAVQSYPPSHRDGLMEIAYRVAQSETPPRSAREWINALARFGYRDFAPHLQRLPKTGPREILARLSAYDITGTPTIVVGGRYSFTPDNAGGDKKLFIELANAVVSKAMLGIA